MHWIVLLLAVGSFAAAVFAPSQGLIVAGMVVGFVCLLAGFVMMIAARIAERSRPDATLLTDADVNALRKSVREARAAREAGKTATPDRSGRPS